MLPSNCCTGGKLPGLSGGENNGRACGGGIKPEFCFSYRLMWRRGGVGEAYVYAPQNAQSPTFCSGLPACGASGPYPCTTCDLGAGTSFYRGSFKFALGSWTKVRLHMVLNPANVTNGILQLAVNDQTVIDYREMNWRQFGSECVVSIFALHAAQHPTNDTPSLAFP